MMMFQYVSKSVLYIIYTIYTQYTPCKNLSIYLHEVNYLNFKMTFLFVN